MTDSLVFSMKDIREKEGFSFAEAGPALKWIGGEKSRPEDLRDLVDASCLSGECAVSVQFSVGGERVLAEMDVQGTWELACTRCLAPHSSGFENHAEETFPVSAETVDLREDVRELVLLSFPPRSLCSTSCRGLCPSCGKDLNRGDCACKTAIH